MNSSINLNHKKESLLSASLAIAVLIIMIFRAFLAINISDEIFNISESFRTILGNSYLIENWDLYQMGDSFIYPFLKLFYMVTGSTDGIVLYTRLIYCIITTAEAVFSYYILKTFFSKTISYFTVLVYFTAVSFKIFNFWYDSFELLFQTMGLLLLFYYFESGKKANKSTLFFAGLFHAMMVYSYPTTALTVLFVVCVFVAHIVKSPKDEKKSVLKDLSLYVLGGFLVFLVFVIFVLYNGVDNFFIFQKSVLQSSLSDSGRANILSISGFFERISDLTALPIKYYILLLVACVGLLAVRIFIKNKKISIFLIFGCIILGIAYIVCWNSRFQPHSADNMLMYISFFTPALLTLFDKEERKKYRNLILFVFIPSYIAGLAYGITALNGYQKISTGARLASIVSFIILYDAFKKYLNQKYSKILICGFMSVLLSLNIINIYIKSFQGTQPIYCNTIETEGVFKGLIDDKEKLKCYSDFQKDLKDIVDESDKTITCGTHSVIGYLVTDLKPNTNLLWTPGTSLELDNMGFTTRVSPDGLISYYNKYYGYSDVFVLKHGEIEEASDEFMSFINSNYNLVKDTDDFAFYKLKNNK